MGFERKIATVEVVRRADEIGALLDALGDERRVPQFPIAQGDVDILGNQVDEGIRDEQIDLNARIGPQERRYEFIERLLSYGDGQRNPEQPLRLSLNLRERPFGIVELAEGFAALIEVRRAPAASGSAGVSCAGEASRRVAPRAPSPCG